jgi:probable HAF family extracellular repeat protein
MKRIWCAWVAVVAWASGSATGATPTFHGLGDLPDGYTESYADDVSADGSVIVGTSKSRWPGAAENPGKEAFRWTQAGGMVGLGSLSPGPTVMPPESQTTGPSWSAGT